MTVYVLIEYSYEVGEGESIQIYGVYSTYDKAVERWSETAFVEELEIEWSRTDSLPGWVNWRYQIVECDTDKPFPNFKGE